MAEKPKQFTSMELHDIEEAARAEAEGWEDVERVVDNYALKTRVWEFQRRKAEILEFELAALKKVHG